MKRIVVLISGQGSNMEAIVRASRAEAWPAEVVAVISNRPDAAGLAAARALGLDTEVLDHRAFPDRAAFDAVLAERIDARLPHLVVLAGFMRILTAEFVARYDGRMLNIHPSLLPAFTGLDTHRRALAAGCRIAGATVHFVTPALDHGAIVVQAAVPVRAEDDERTLAQRVQAAEHRIYPQAVRWFVGGRLARDGARVRQLDGEPQAVFAPGA